jgi:hypothetical protein
MSLCALSSMSWWTGAVSRSFGKRDQISYHSLWVHTKRHYNLAGRVAYWRTRMSKELRNALGG